VSRLRIPEPAAQPVAKFRGVRAPVTSLCPSSKQIFDCSAQSARAYRATIRA
jgi:GTP cyclohydrolase FolE2